MVFLKVTKTGHGISRFLEITRNTPPSLSENHHLRMPLFPIHMVPENILVTNENHRLKLPP